MFQYRVLITILNNFYTLEKNVVILLNQLVKHLYQEIFVSLFLLFVMPLLLQLCDSFETHRSPTHWTRRFTLLVPRFCAPLTKSMSTSETTPRFTFVAHWTLHGPCK